jgi:hypothetical protein
MEKRVALSLARLNSENSLMNCREPFRIPDSIACIIIREFCHAIKTHVMPLVIPKFTLSRITINLC